MNPVRLILRDPRRTPDGKIWPLPSIAIENLPRAPMAAIKSLRCIDITLRHHNTPPRHDQNPSLHA
jgi:hypothetical protein